MIEYCSYCKTEKAVWFYGPSCPEGTGLACDNCVPRGCTCNEEPIDGDYENGDSSNWEQDVDELGREYPCVEWMNIADTYEVD